MRPARPASAERADRTVSDGGVLRSRRSGASDPHRSTHRHDTGRLAQVRQEHGLYDLGRSVRTDRSDEGGVARRSGAVCLAVAAAQGFVRGRLGAMHGWNDLFFLVADHHHLRAAYIDDYRDAARHRLPLDSVLLNLFQAAGIQGEKLMNGLSNLRFEI